MVKNILTLLSFFVVIVCASTLTLPVNGKNVKSKVNPAEIFFKRIVRGHLWYTFESDMSLPRINPIKTKVYEPNKFFEKFANFLLKNNEIKHL
jgi:hypothetical protein